MRFFLPATLITCLTIVPQGLRAQSGVSTGKGDPVISFDVPVKLSNVMSDISKVAVWCRITSSAIIGPRGGAYLQAQVEVPVTAGQVDTTVRVDVVATNLDTPAGKSATYVCALSGYSTARQTWDVFSDTHALPAFRLSPTPAPLSGSFVW
jgi:hypothetical protein